jgi:hypothetical protein
MLTALGAEHTLHPVSSDACGLAPHGTLVTHFCASLHAAAAAAAAAVGVA